MLLGVILLQIQLLLKHIINGNIAIIKRGSITVSPIIPPRNEKIYPKTISFLILPYPV
ncbi:MAG: hypothetical protein LBU40_02630 [Methanobrevibacter sp.]|nr:hypothetical protein [Methanobrevibacter sp.]